MGILIDLLKDIFASRNTNPIPDKKTIAPSSATHKVLNVGGGSKNTPIPDYYSDWQHDLLDINPRGNPEIVCDARELASLEAGQYDAVYCSHNLEHYYRHEGLDVVKGFVHILKADGFAEIRVPDIALVISAVQEQNLDLDDVLYQSAAGPITAHDVIYGFQPEIVSSGQDYYAHKTGFTPQSLTTLLLAGGFQYVFLISDEHLAVHALAFKDKPTTEQHALLTPTWDLPAA